MSPMERLGLAFCRLENLCWDVAAGEKPNGFDEADDRGKRKLADEPMRKIKAILGTQYINRCRWVFDLHKSEESWLEIQSRLYDKIYFNPIMVETISETTPRHSFIIISRYSSRRCCVSGGKKKLERPSG